MCKYEQNVIGIFLQYFSCRCSPFSETLFFIFASRNEGRQAGMRRRKKKLEETMTQAASI